MIELGHVVFYVRDLGRSLHFYSDTIGLTLSGKIFNGRAAVLSGGRTHHELLLIEVGHAPEQPRGRRIGLYHVGWKIGESLQAFKQMRDRLLKQGYEIEGQSDHTVSQSLYLMDPDGNEVELYVDNPEFDWQVDDSWMTAAVKPLVL